MNAIEPLREGDGSHSEPSSAVKATAASVVAAAAAVLFENFNRFFNNNKFAFVLSRSLRGSERTGAPVSSARL